VTEEKTQKLVTIAVLGGTGKEGSGLAMRWAHSGYRVLIGSRDAGRAATKASELNRELGNELLAGMDNAEAAAKADIVVLSVPYAAHKEILGSVREQIKGKVLIDVTVPLQPPQIRQVNIPEGHAAALEAQAFLGDEVRVVAAFQNVSYVHIKEVDSKVDCDVLVCADDEDAKTETLQLVEAAGMRGIDAGPLANAVAAESLTPVILYINKKYKTKSAGIRITGLPK
jgi:hypothetical protein